VAFESEVGKIFFCNRNRYPVILRDTLIFSTIPAVSISKSDHDIPWVVVESDAVYTVDAAYNLYRITWRELIWKKERGKDLHIFRVIS
jgi:hypothetical protein